MLALFLEFSPAIAEWLNAKKMRKVLAGMTMGAVVFGITLSVLHQAGIGALFLMAKGKIHPLWYHEYLPIMFVVASIFGGISMVIFEGSISHRVFADQIDKKDHHSHNDILHGLAKICTLVMFVYLFMTIIILVHEHELSYLGTSMGLWYLVEIIGFVLLPMILFYYSYRKRNISLIKVASIMTLVGIILNRMNISIICFKWDAAVRYVPSWQEFIVTLTVIFIEIWVFRWIVLRMPVLRKSPAWVKNSH
jgi:Ni/Fe-hydrogenase subunit HybB-like protein